MCYLSVSSSFRCLCCDFRALSSSSLVWLSSVFISSSLSEPDPTAVPPGIGSASLTVSIPDEQGIKTFMLIFPAAFITKTSESDCPVNSQCLSYRWCPHGGAVCVQMWATEAELWADGSPSAGCFCPRSTTHPWPPCAGRPAHNNIQTRTLRSVTQFTPDISVWSHHKCSALNYDTLFNTMKVSEIFTWQTQDKQHNPHNLKY